MDVAPVTIRPARLAEYERVGALTAAAYQADQLGPPGYDRVLRAVAHRAAYALVLVAVTPTDELLGAVTYAAGNSLYARLGFVREPARDWSPAPGVTLLAYSFDLAMLS